MREKYLSLSLGTLKELAKARGMKGISTLKKSELIERMLQEDEKDKKIEIDGASIFKDNILIEKISLNNMYNNILFYKR